MKVAHHKLLQLALLFNVLAVSMTVHAFNPQPEPPATPPLGMTINETIVVNVAVPPDAYAAAATPIQVQLGLFDAAGVLRAELTTEVSLGKIVSMEIAGDKLGIPAGQRMSFQGVVQCKGGSKATQRCAQSINASMELFDSTTGKSSIVVPVVAAIVPVIAN